MDSRLGISRESKSNSRSGAEKHRGHFRMMTTLCFITHETQPGGADHEEPGEIIAQ